MRSLFLAVATVASVASLLVAFTPANSFAAPLSVDCNFMTTTLISGQYIKGRAVKIRMDDQSTTAALLEAFTQPYDMSGFMLRLINAPCNEGAQHCSLVTLSVVPTAQVNILNQTMNTYPQRDTATSTSSGTSTFKVIDQDYHPMTTGIVTYEAKAQIGSFSDRALNVKMACVLKTL